MRAETALKDDRPWDALAAARELLDLVPDSLQGQSLWAESAEAAGLDEEAVEALEGLVRRVPFRADVWLRLAQARARSGRSPRGALERAVVEAWPVDASDAARIWLCDLDQWRGDVERAERWLERCSPELRKQPAWGWRQVEVLLDTGRRQEALERAADLPQPETLDGPGWLVQAKLWAAQGNPAADWALERALSLEAPRSGPVVAQYLVERQDALFVSRIREVVNAFGWQAHPGWQAAFAEAEGRLDDALAALARGAREDPDVPWLLRYARVAASRRSFDALAEAGRGLAALGAELPRDLALVLSLREATPAARLDGLLALETSGWSRELLDQALRDLTEPPRWGELLEWLGGLAFEVGALALRRDLESLNVELERPLRVAVVGEFNAGKSSFINAWLGESVAPVGVIPTTAKTHRLAWAPDPYVRIELTSGLERVVPHAELTRELAATEDVKRVVIFAPHESLQHVELIDTPGFNSGDDKHTDEVTAALGEAHVALWLVDASQPLKASERDRMHAIQRLGLPLVVVVNKLDRLVDEQRTGVIEHVRQALDEQAIGVEYPLIGVSARQAIEPAQRVLSGWEQVESLLDRLRQDAGRLKDRALLGRLKQVLRRWRASSAEVEAAEPVESQIKPGALDSSLVQALTRLEQDLQPLPGGELESRARAYAARRAEQRVLEALRELGLPRSAQQRAAGWALGAWPRLKAAVRAAGLEDTSLGERRAELVDELRGLLERDLELQRSSAPEREASQILRRFAEHMSGES
ncbi:MAG: dynamin family protein [Myxococcales bacterium]|nr:dynamin family protein [Myxococcales bacterium]